MRHGRSTIILIAVIGTVLLAVLVGWGWYAARGLDANANITAAEK